LDPLSSACVASTFTDRRCHLRTDFFARIIFATSYEECPGRTAGVPRHAHGAWPTPRMHFRLFSVTPHSRRLLLAGRRRAAGD
jgi:hypothetical protein